MGIVAQLSVGLSSERRQSGMAGEMGDDVYVVFGQTERVTVIMETWNHWAGMLILALNHIR